MMSCLDIYSQLSSATNNSLHLQGVHELRQQTFWPLLKIQKKLQQALLLMT